MPYIQFGSTPHGDSTAPSAPPPEGNDLVHAVIQDAVTYLLQRIDSLGVRFNSGQNLSQLPSNVLQQILDRTAEILDARMPSAPPFEPETPAKPIPSAPPFEPETPAKPIPSAPPLPLDLAGRAGPAAPMAPAPRTAAAVVTASANPAHQSTLTGITPRMSHTGNSPAEFGKIALTNPSQSGPIGGNAVMTPSPPPFPSAKNTNIPPSTPESAHSTPIETVQKEPLSQSVTPEAPVVESESVVIAFSESLSFNTEASEPSEQTAQIVFQSEQTLEDHGREEMAQAQVDAQRAEISEFEERTFNAPFTERDVQQRGQAAMQMGESRVALKEGRASEVAAEQEKRTILENSPSPKAAVLNPRAQEEPKAFSEMSSLVGEANVQNQLGETSPLPQSSTPPTALPNSSQSLEARAGLSEAPSPERRAPPSEILQQASLQTAPFSGAPSSQMPSQSKPQAPPSTPTRQALTEAGSSKESSQEQGAVKAGSKPAQSSNQGTVVPYSAQSPIQGSSSSKNIRTGSIQPIEEFPDEDFDEEDEDEEDEDEEEDDGWY